MGWVPGGYRFNSLVWAPPREDRALGEGDSVGKNVGTCLEPFADDREAGSTCLAGRTAGDGEISDMTLRSSWDGLLVALKGTPGGSAQQGGQPGPHLCPAGSQVSWWPGRPVPLSPGVLSPTLWHCPLPGPMLELLKSLPLLQRQHPGSGSLQKPRTTNRTCFFPFSLPLLGPASPGRGHRPACRATGPVAGATGRSPPAAGPSPRMGAPVFLPVIAVFMSPR